MNDGKLKTNRGVNNLLDNLIASHVLKVGEVISVDDPNYLGRIKVRIKGPRNKGGDDGVLDNDLPWCFPFIPKYFFSTPKEKEAVFIFTFGKDREHSDRMYIGPIISQPQKLDFDPYYFTALRGFSFASQLPDVSPSTIPELKGLYPSKDDISVQGRDNTDITQKKNEIVIRAGKFTQSKPSTNNPFSFKFNSETQGFIQIKNNVVVSPSNSEKQSFGTVTNIVSNKINLITHKDGSPRFNVTNQDNLISDDELAKILDEAHQLPFGDVLLEYLRLLKDALLNHVHNGSGNPATDLTSSGNKQAIAAFKSKADDLEKSMLSKNIRIN